jgi:hypothetical protein
MTNNLDDLFSPERLRHRWQQDEVPAEKQEQADLQPSEDAMAVFKRLQSRIQERFPGEQGQPLALLMNELEELLLRRFPQTENAHLTDDDKASLDPAIAALLNEIEDLVEALEL